MERNQMEMRETLLVVRDALDTISAHEDDIEFVRAWIGQTKNAVQEALSAPPRQCDVGTAEEQEERYLKLKREHVDRMARCPAVGQSFFFPDSLYWAQMPYEAQEGAEE